MPTASVDKDTLSPPINLWSISVADLVTLQTQVGSVMCYTRLIYDSHSIILIVIL